MSHGPEHLTQSFSTKPLNVVIDFSHVSEWGKTFTTQLNKLGVVICRFGFSSPVHDCVSSPYIGSLNRRPLLLLFSERVHETFGMGRQPDEVL